MMVDDVSDIKDKLEFILKTIKNYEKDYIFSSSSFEQILDDYKNIEIDYKTFYTLSHNEYYRDLNKRITQFKNSDHYILIELLKKNPTLKKKINKEIKLENKLKKIKTCNKTSENSLFTKKRLICQCKYSMFSNIPQTFSDFNVSIETLLDPVFAILIDESNDEYNFLKQENKISEFLKYLNANSEKLDDILQKVALIIENKSMETINLNEILNNLKGKYKKSEDFIKKFKTKLKKKEEEIKKKNTDIIFEYEL